MGRLRVDDSEFKQLLKDLDKMPKVVMKQAFTYYKNATPVRSGNARNKTKYMKSMDRLESNYPYAGRLDEGWSKQAPKGFTGPTSDQIENYIDSYIDKVD